jgi:hypothetical protein
MPPFGGQHAARSGQPSDGGVSPASRNKQNAARRMLRVTSDVQRFACTRRHGGFGIHAFVATRGNGKQNARNLRI